MAAIDAVQPFAENAEQQYRRGARQHLLHAVAAQHGFDALQCVRQGGDHRGLARLDQDPFHCKTSDFVILSG